jgi:maleylacetoacetate isomerase
VHLLRDGGAQHSPDFRGLNPQGLVPVLRDGDAVLTQSLAIIEYLDEVYPQTPLLPAGAAARAAVRAMALSIACDIHPINNLRVRRYLADPLGHGDAEIGAWQRHWIATGFAALEQFVQRAGSLGRHCFADQLTLADVLLVPQMLNARRLGLDLALFPTLVSIDACLRALPAFAAAAPPD